MPWRLMFQVPIVKSPHAPPRGFRPSSSRLLHTCLQLVKSPHAPPRGYGKPGAGSEECGAVGGWKLARGSVGRGCTEGCLLPPLFPHAPLRDVAGRERGVRSKERECGLWWEAGRWRQPPPQWTRGRARLHRRLTALWKCGHPFNLTPALRRGAGRSTGGDRSVGSSPEIHAQIGPR